MDLRCIVRPALAFACAALVLPGHSANAQTGSITLNGQAVGREFEGLGAVSGGGNTTRLLPDYPEPERSQILDYMFKPRFGASLNALKVEVGGDINSTEGSEPSHMHTQGDENYTRGFEWWLMTQAKKRNPEISLDCLAWGAPGWVGNGSFWSTDMMDYYIRFIKGAKRYYGLDIGSVGGKNESGYDSAWFIAFRKALDAAGLSRVKLVASDNWGPPWLNIANDSLHDPALAKSIDVFSGHVTWSENPAVASQAILKTGKPLWDTEMHNYVDNSRAQLDGFAAEIGLVNDFNTNYIKTKITKTLFWNLIWSYYPISSYPDVGMMIANSPWSGNYVVKPEVWGYAHVNQFVRPGWRFLDGGGNGMLPAGGTFTALVSPTRADYSVIIETNGASGTQTIRVSAVGGLPGKELHVWMSDSAVQFVHIVDIKPTDGTFTLTLAPNTIYSVSTTTGQHKGNYPAPPKDKAFPMPYSDSFAEYRPASQARYLYDYEGAFEIAKKTTGEGMCLRQDATKSASGWGGAYLPLTFLGSSDWKDYSVSVNAYIENFGSVALHGRIQGLASDGEPYGYAFRVGDNGSWQLINYKSVIASGQTQFGANAWHRLRLSFRGTTVSGFIDGHAVFTVHDASASAGYAGLGTGWNYAQFSDLTIEPS